MQGIPSPAELSSTTSSPAPAQASAPSSDNPAPIPAPAVEPAPTPAPAEEEYDLETAENSPITEEQLNAFATKAGEYGLSKEQAQDMLSLVEKSFQDGVTKQTGVYAEHINAAREEWKAAPEFQGEAAAASWASVNKAIEEFGDASFKEMMNVPGVGDQLKLAQFLKKIGDKLIAAQNPTDLSQGKGAQINTDTKPKSMGHVMFPEFFEPTQK